MTRSAATSATDGADATAPRTTAAPPKRQTVAKFGMHGATIHVFTERIGQKDATRVEWRELGRRKTRSFFGPKRTREQEAKAFAQGVLQHPARGRPAEAKRLLVKDIWHAYLLAHADWRPKTLQGASTKWKEFMGFLSPYTFADEVTAETLDAWRANLLKRTRKHGAPMARNQVALHLQLVKSVWKHAVQRQLLEPNNIGTLNTREGRSYAPLEIPEYSPEEFAACLRCLDSRRAVQWRAWAALALAGLLGKRASELLSLEWKSIDLAMRVIIWPKENNKIPEVHEQPLPRDAVRVLRICRVWARRAGYAGPYVFFGAQDRSRHKPWSYSSFHSALCGAEKRAGVRHVKFRAVHGLRRKVLNDGRAATGGDLVASGAFIGSRDLRTLKRSYARERVGDLDAIRDTMALPPRAAPGTCTPATKTATKRQRPAETGGPSGE